MKLLLATLVCLGSAVSAQSDETFVFVDSDGQQLEAGLVSIGEELIEMSSGGQARSVPVDQIITIRRRGVTAAAGAAIEVRLVDGSSLQADELTATDHLVIVSRNAGNEFGIPRREIKYVRLVRVDDPSLADRWNEIVNSGDQSGDLLVFQRDSQLDYLEGLVGDISADSVAFSNNGKVNQAPRTRVSGVVYYQGIERAFGQPTGMLRTICGDAIAVRAARVEGDQLFVATICGVEFELPLDQFVSLELGNRRVAYLGKLEPATIEWQPLVLNPELIEHQRVLNRPRFDQSFDNQILRLKFPQANVHAGPAKVVEYSHGMAVKAGTRMVFELGGQYTSLTGVAGFSPNAPTGGNVELVIAGDGRELARQVLANPQSGPTELALDIAGVQRLSIEVNYHDGRNIGDLLHLCDLKVSR